MAIMALGRPNTSSGPRKNTERYCAIRARSMLRHLQSGFPQCLRVSVVKGAHA